MYSKFKHFARVHRNTNAYNEYTFCAVQANILQLLRTCTFRFVPNCINIEPCFKMFHAGQVIYP